MASDQDFSAEAPRAPLLHDPRVRGIIYQVVVLAIVVAVGFYLVGNVQDNLARLGIASGFGFLDSVAGFPISQNLIDYNISASSYGRAFLVGIVNTIYVAIVGIVLSTIIGFIMGVARLSKNALVAGLASFYVETMRNIPLLLQLIFWYVVVIASLPRVADSIKPVTGVFLNNRGLTIPSLVFADGSLVVGIACLAGIVAAFLFARYAKRHKEETGNSLPTLWIVLGLILVPTALAYLVMGAPIGLSAPEANRFRITGGLTMLPEFLALLLGLSIYTGAFIAEIVRSGILSVSKGQTEAAHALGLKPNHTLRFVIIPQALRVIIPPQTSQYLNLTKNSSLAVAIGYPELFHVGGTINNQTGQAVEVVAIIMAVYLTLSLLTSLAMNIYNERMALKER
ncbi:MAG: amino acid ABC transporter permease [Geminicoccaceae bacterium]